MENKEKKEQQFKKLLSTLPEDKRNELFSRLKSVSPSEREALIDKILSTAENKTKAEPNRQPAPKQPKQQPKKQQKQQPKPQPKQEPKVVNKPKPQPKPKTEKPKTDPKKKTEIIAVVSILVVFVGICLGIKILFGDKMDAKVEQIEAAAATSTAETTETSAVTTESVETTTQTTVETTPAPTPTPTPVPVALKEDHPDLTGLVIVIDPGHQATKSAKTEEVKAGGKTKAGATTGAVGTETGVPEYELTLDISLKLQSYLEGCGATVILTRTSNEVDITNQERAAVATSNNADLFIRIHADAANDSKQSGVKVFVPNSGNYTNSNSKWGDDLGNKVAESIGLEFLGTKSTDVYTGLNYANTVPSFQISLGLISNCDDEAALVNEDNQIEICAAISQFAVGFVKN
ncbi:MAG: N-acetylmuramoyl-L-alanine amidase [Lachnospiraceae bacterium]|nr:N-acetylmuramoyl-L-alanine amidase [Lachnospiraceae bacterium]